MRVLIVAIDWHGDVAPALAGGFRELQAEPVILYYTRQRRQGLRARVEAELLHNRFAAARVRARQQDHATETIREALRSCAPDVSVVLSPDTLSEAAVEQLLSSDRSSWWFGDDPRAFARRGLSEPAPVLQLIDATSVDTFVAHPAWAVGALAGAAYLPYGAVNPAVSAAICDPSRRVDFPYVVVGSPRPERAEVLGELAEELMGGLHVWGWGRRGRLGLASAARPFRAALRGTRPLSRAELEAVYRSAGVVINLQDPQMVGAWNPQTFDVMGIGTPQVVWNQDPVALFDHAPPIAHDISRLVTLCRAQREAPAVSEVVAGHAEVRRRHTWRARAYALASHAASPTSPPPAVS